MTTETKSFIRDVVVLALPVGFQFLINNVVNVIDGVMIGTLGEASITAVSVSTTFLWLVSTVIMAIANGAAIIGAQDYGKGRLDRIKKLLSIVCVLSVIVSLFFFIIMTIFPVQIIQIYTNIESVVQPGCDYFKFIKYSLMFNAISVAIVALLRSVRSVKLGLYNSLMSCFSNVFFNWVFIYGHLGFPAMGVAGAALGTLIARIIEFLVSVIYLLYFEKNLSFKISDFQPSLDKESVHQWVKITLPLLAIDVQMNLASSVQTMITGRISDSYISANSIVHNAWALPNVFLMGVSAAASIMIGNAIGQGDKEKAKRDSQRFVYASVAFGLFGGIMVQVLLPILSQFYRVSATTLTLAKEMGYAASISVLFLGASSILCNGVIKAGGMTNKILMVNIISTWVIAIPFGYLSAFVFHWSAPVIYLILRAGNIFKSIWAWYQLRNDHWITTIE